MRRWRELWRAPRELAAGHDDALQVPGESCGPGEPGSAVGHERYDLPARDQHGRTTVGAILGLARAEPGAVGGEFPHADARDRGRKRLPRAAQQFTRILERPAAHAGSESAHRVS